MIMKTLHTIYSTFAKHNMASLRLLLVMLLTLTASTAWGKTQTYTLAKNDNGKTITTDDVTWDIASGAIDESSSKCKLTGTITVSLPAGATLNSVTITGNGNSWGSGATITFNGNTTLYTFSSCSTYSLTKNKTDLTYSFVKSGTSSKNAWVKSITVDYTAAPSCSEKPTIGTELQSVTATENSIKATIPITAVGGCNITENGLVYSTTNSTPTVDGSGCTTVTTTACGSTAANKTVTITGLTCGKSYYIRGYATNAAGTSYTNVTTKSTSDCPKYTVTLKDDNSTLTQSTAGEVLTLPKREGCDGYEFVGWTKSWSVAQTTWTTTAPEIISAGEYTPTANESLYPVYTKTEGGGSEPTAYSAGDVGSFIIASNVGNKWYAIPENPTLSSSKITGVEITVSQTDGGVKYVSTANAEGYTWKIANATNGQTISDGSKYIYHSNGGASGTNLAYGTSTSYTWKIEKETNGLTFKGMSGSTTNSRGLLFNGSVFGGYALSNEDASGYYRIQVLPIGGGSTTYYISVPDCCTPLAEVTGLKYSNITSNSITVAVPDDYSDIANASGYTFNCYSALTGGTLIATADESGTSHTFTGLTKNTTYYFTVIAKGEGKYCNSIEISPRESSKTLAQYTVILNPNGGSGTFTGWTANGSNYTKTVDAGTQLTLPTLSKTGYDFAGWNDGTTTVTSPYTPTKDITLTAQWTAIEYTITYQETKGATNSNPATYTIEDAITFEALTDLPKGYNFTGWNPASIAKGTTGNQTVTAQWTEKPLTRYRTDCDACIPLDGYAEINGTYHFFPGETITLTVTPPADADPADCTYQWQKKVNSDYENIEGETGLTYTKENATTSDVGHYRCVVSSEGYCDLYPKYNVKCLQLYVYYDNKSDVFNTPLNRGAEENTATISVDLQNANYKYYFKITDGCGNWYGNTGTMVRDNCTNWSMDVNEYCGLQTTKFGTYVFNVNYSDLAHLTVSVIYPAALQEAGKEIYLDNNVLKWTYSNNADGTNKIYYRIGRSDHNNKIAMDLVPGTANLYKVTTSKYDNFDVWHIANNGCHSEFNSIFKTKTNDKWAATQATAFETLPVTLDAVTVTPTTLRSVGGDNNNNNCEFYNYDITEGMKTWNAKIVEPTNGTITVSYTHHDGTVVSDFTSGDRDLAHTCLLTITATPDAGYKLGTLTVNDVAFTSGNVHTLTEDTEIKVTWTEKSIPTFKWSADSYTAALEADNNYPTLDNPNSLSVTYKSSDENVAKIDVNGNVILGAEGWTTITATGAETATHKSATTTYKLTVVESNCRWVEVEIGDIEPEDEVLVVMEWGETLFTMANNGGASGPLANTITTNDLAANSVAETVVWNISKNGDGTLTFYPNGITNKWLYCTANYVGVGTNEYNKFTIEYGYLKHYGLNKYLAVAVNAGTKYWHHYALESSNVQNQTLKFYKRECLDATNYWVTWDAGEGAWTDGSSKKLESYQVGARIIKPTEPTREGYRFDGWTPTIETMPAENTTFTAVWTKVYKVTWYENGVPSYTYVPSDNAVVTWEDNIADCGEKKFYGWTADDTFVSDPTTPPTLISKGTTIAGDVTYYAVYADAEVPANPGYTKVTTISEGTYLIATDATTGKAYTGKSGSNTYGGYCAVEIENDVISEKPDAAVEVTVTSNGSNFYMHDGTYYLGYTSGNAMTFDTSIQTGNQNIWKLTTEGHIESVNVSGRILQYNSGSPRFACYTSNQQKAYLYKKQTTTYKNFAVSCATYTITVTTPTGGTVTTTPADEAGAGQTITVNVTPAECKYLTALKYNDGSDHSINISSTSYTFTMPAADVTVTATFADKTATDIEILTSAHRLLMQGSAFVGEQVRITYNNGDKETLNWNDSRLTFTGHNTATLGSQTVTVTYNDCGTQSASYNIEVIDGLGITFWDGDYTETIKYEPGDLVDVDNRIGQNICSGWEFAGWSETKVANESNGFTPVHNFNATDAKVLYAVYVQTSTDWISAYNIDELHPGAKYVIVAHYSDGKEFALTNTNNTSSSYLDGANLTTDCEKVREGEAYPYKDRYKLKVTPDENWKWQLENTGSGWTMRNIKANKYLKVNSDKTISLTATPDDKFTLSNGYNDSEITAQSSSNYYLSWYNSSKYWNGHTSGQQYYLTNETNFTSTPPCSPLSATFHGNGGIVTDGVNSGDDLTITEPTRDAGITTPIASFADCNGKTWTFVGWAREEIDVTRVPVLTTDLLHDGGGNKHYYIQEDGEEFWAVFTNTGDPETKYGTIAFTDADVTRQYENAKTITKSVTAMGDYDFELYRVSNASSKGIQFDHEVATRGYIKNITSLGKINSISLNDFQTGDINDVKVYVGNTPNAINTLLTEADLQKTGNTYTYYPPKNYAYVKIEATGYCGITSISIDFGKGTQIWATTPNCSDIFLSGNELYVTSTKGQSIRAAERLTVKAVQLESKAKVVISSNCSDIYFSDVLDANFTQAVKPTETLTLTTNVDGNLSATEIYVHYRPSVDGTGIPEDVVVSANLETPNPSITDDHTIHVRNLPADFVIAAKWDGHWYALPANCTSSQSPIEGLLIEVDNIDDPKMAIAAPASAKFGLRSVYTSNSTNDQYEKNGANLVFVENVTEETPVANQTLYNGSETGIQVYAQYANYHTGNALRYEWTPTTTNLLDYTLTSAHTFTKTDGTPEEARTISLGNNGVFGTLLNDKSYNGEVRLLPATFYEPASAQVLKWKANSVIVMYTGTETTATTQVGDNAKSDEQTLANQQLTHGIYELTTNQSLTDHAGGELNIYIGTNTRVELEIPLIISGEVTASANAHDVVILENSKLTAAETKYSYKDVYVYGGAKLAIPENTELGVNNIILRAGGVATDGAGQNATYQYIYPQVELKGTLTSAVQNIRYEYVTDNDHWYHLVLPFDGSLASIHYPYEYYGDQVKLDNKGSWIIKRYDGATRATGNYDAWVDIETEGKTSTTAGQGYIFWGAPKKVTANGAYERPKWGIQRITMLSKVSETINEATKAEKNDKTVSGLSSHKDVPNNSGAVNDQGWNLIGNPYMVNLTGLNSESLKPGKLVEVEDAAGNWTGQWKDNEDGFRYVTIPSDHFDTYTAQRMTAFTEANPMIAGRAFFIQLEDDDAGVTFSAANRASLLAARVAANEPTTDIETGIVLSNETLQDEVNFWIKDGKTNDYEYNADYPKTPNNNHFNIYGVHTNGDLSWVATGPEFAKESMPIGYQVPDAGTYMLSVSEEYYSDEIDALYVTDHEMSPEVTTDLMSAPYEFSVNQAETNDKRFTVSIKLKKDSENDATGLDNININGEEIQKFIYQDKMYILHHGIIYDATGKRVITINK